MPLLARTSWMKLRSSAGSSWMRVNVFMAFSWRELLLPEEVQPFCSLKTPAWWPDRLWRV